VGNPFPTAPRSLRSLRPLRLMNVGEQFGLYWPNLIAQIVLFFIVYFVLSRFAFKPIMAMLEERRRRIEEGQINAEKIKQQLAEAQTKYEETLARANAEAQRLIEEVKASGERLAEEKRQTALAEAEDIIRRTHDSLSLERERTMAELKKELGRLVVETTEKVTNKILTPQDHQKINEETARQIAA
jgi:F-type H+-transporting ATPase subunit b